MQLDVGDGSDQSKNQGWPDQSSNQGWPAQNVPRRGGGLLGQGPGSGGWGNSGNGFGGFGGNTGGVAGGFWGFGGNTVEVAEGFGGFRGGVGGSRGGGSDRGGIRVGGSGSGGSKDDWSEFLKEQYDQLGDQDSSQSTEQQPQGQFLRGRGRGGSWNNGRGRW